MSSTANRNRNKDKKQSIMTKETLGVVLILFATLALVCLITRETLFSLPGQYVNAFLLGCFGGFAYAVVVWVILMGVLLITDKKIGLSKKRKSLVTLCFVLLALLSHVISMRALTATGSQTTYGAYLSESYLRGADGISTATAGGLFTGLVAYVFAALLTNVGSYVVLGVSLAVSIYFTVCDFLKADGGVKAIGARFKGAFVKSEKEKPVPSGIKIEGEKEYPVQDAAFTEPRTVTKPKLFVNNPDDFAMRTKRDIAKEKGEVAMKFGFSDHGLGVVSSAVDKPTAAAQPSPSYTDEFKNKLDYIKTPAAINVEKIGSNNYSTPNPYAKREEQTTSVSDYVNSVEEKTVQPVEEEIPHHEHNEEIVSDSAESHARFFGNRYAQFEEVDKDIVPAVEAEEVFRPAPEVVEEKVEQTIQPEQIAVEEERTIERQVEPDITIERNVRDRGFDIPFIEENQEEIIPDADIERDTAPIEEPEEKPTDSVIGSSRVRGIFFGEEESEKPTNQAEEKTVEEEKEQPQIGFTSRVVADDNLGARRRIEFNEEPIAEKEPEPEIEKPKKPAPPINREYFRPPLDLLETHAQPVNAGKENHEERMEIIQRTLEEFHISAVPQSYVQGPSITRYEIMMPAGISVKKVLNYDDDLKMRLAVRDGVRIEAPIPGKNLVGIEVANNVKVMVGLKEVMEGLAGKKTKESALMFALGKDIVGNSISDDLTKGPHYLIAGATGSGKSVALHVMLVSLLMRYSPEELKLVLVDPKSVEFRKYEHIPHLLVDEIVTEPKRALTLLHWAYEETNRRNNMFTECGGMISNIEDYNSQIASDTVPKLPRIVFVIDELADLMETCKKDLEEKIRRIAAKSRSAGIHLVLATQRPSVDVVTGTIKANLPSRIALKVMNFADSQTILGMAGAEKLLGNGDMLYKNSTMSDFERYQGAYISGREITNIVNYIKEHNAAYFDDDVQEFLDKETRPKQEENTAGAEENESNANEVSELFKQALWLAVNSGTASISQFQRRFGIGYAKAGGLIDKMERMKFVSGNEGSKARRVLITKEDFENRFGAAPDDDF
ncbi:MAG: hypothetical protein E7346_04965 [Clostridiales bacterium]|nr:hypothetical protein [Clostridiales bacterium]